jgi:hypothetical protein
MLALDKDQRVVDGGVSDRTASQVKTSNQDEAESEMREMLEALARRTGEGGADTKH